jgi:hypothetical protein
LEDAVEWKRNECGKNEAIENHKAAIPGIDRSKPTAECGVFQMFG